MKKITVLCCVHSGVFHADDVYATALAKMWCEQPGQDCMLWDIKRLHRETFESDLKSLSGSGRYSDIIVLDIGGGKYDHHDDAHAVYREDGSKYAAFGLYFKDHWADFGLNEKMASLFDSTFIEPMDNQDNFGPNKEKGPDAHCLDITCMNALDIHDDDEQLRRFVIAVDMAKTILEFRFETLKNQQKQEEEVANAIKVADENSASVVRLTHYLPAFLFKHSRVHFIVYPTDKKWNVTSVDSTSFPIIGKDKMPEEISKDCTFVHASKFLAVFTSEAAAIGAADMSDVIVTDIA